MGYDPYDFYDLGEFDQKGSIPTWFGTRQELESLIGSAHSHGLSLIADIVINHNSGADAQEVNPIAGNHAGLSSTPRAESSPATGKVFTPVCMSHGTR